MEFEFLQQNTLLFVALVVIIALIVLEPMRKRASGIRELGVLELPRLMNDEDVVIVDVSDEAEYKRGHIVDALSVPLSALEDRMNTLNKHKSKTVVVTCPNGAKSSKAAAQLKKAGFEKLYTLRQGLQAWTRENMPLEKD